MYSDYNLNRISTNTTTFAPSMETAPPQESKKLLSREFWLLCTSSALFMASFGMLIPELPSYLENMGGEDYIGFIVGLFTVTAGLSRFWSGQMADRIGRVKIMIFGSLVTAVCGVLYIYTLTITSFLILRLIHGLSTGWRPVGSTAYLSDIAPVKRRGEAMGYLGVAGTTGMALGPYFGSVIQEEFSYEAMFIASSVLGLLSMIITFYLPESKKNPERFRLSHFNVFGKGPILDFSVMPTFITTLLDTFAFGVVISMSPILMSELGFKYEGVFNLLFVSVGLVLRFGAGKWSDRYGRIPVLRIGMICLFISMVILTLTGDRVSVLIAGIFYGGSIGFNRPTIFAWTAESANPARVATALSTMLLALEIGIGCGAFFSGYVYKGDASNLPYAFGAAAIVALGALVYVFMLKKDHASLQK